MFCADSIAAVLVYMIRFSGFAGFLKVLPLSSLMTLSSVLPLMLSALCCRSQLMVSLGKGA